MSIASLLSVKVTSPITRFFPPPVESHRVCLGSGRLAISSLPEAFFFSLPTQPNAFPFLHSGCASSITVIRTSPGLKSWNIKEEEKQRVKEWKKTGKSATRSTSTVECRKKSRETILDTETVCFFKLSDWVTHSFRIFCTLLNRSRICRIIQCCAVFRCPICLIHRSSQYIFYK